jgi:hypothetical protein
LEKEYNDILVNHQKVVENLKASDTNKTQYINELLGKIQKTNRENKDLKFGLKQMTKNINEANQLYFKKKAEYNKVLSQKDNKLKEYKTKITILKTKINELHQEINTLKNKGGTDLKSFNKNCFNNDKNKNQIKKEPTKKRCFTPKERRKKIPFDFNIENKTTIENNGNSEIFGDIKISDLPKDYDIIQPNDLKENFKDKCDLVGVKKPNKKKKNSDINKLTKIEQEKKFIQECKDTLNKLDELNK